VGRLRQPLGLCRNGVRAKRGPLLRRAAHELLWPHPFRCRLPVCCRTKIVPQAGASR